MKKLIVFFLLACLTFTGYSQTGTAEGWMDPLDTLTNADSHSDTITITGPKASVSFLSKVLKLTGTVAGTVNIFGSVDGTNFGTTALTTINLTDASANWQAAYDFNGYKAYRIVTATTGTSTASVRHWYMYRKAP
jgi:hypothetical protein